MKIVIDKADKLADIVTSRRNNIWLLPENVEIEIDGNITLDQPIKTSGNSSITGTNGSSIRFVDKGTIACSSNARRLSICNLSLISDADKAILSVAQTTARTVTLHGLTVSAKTFGQCHASTLLMSQCSFLNDEMPPLKLGAHLDSLVLNGIRYDGSDCLLDFTQSSLGSGLVSEIFIKNEEAGLLLLNDKVNHVIGDRRYNIHPNSIVMKNVQGLNRELDIFRQRREDGKLTHVNYNLTEQYVI